jgi:hypothetical protein
MVGRGGGDRTLSTQPPKSLNQFTREHRFGATRGQNGRHLLHCVTLRIADDVTISSQRDPRIRMTQLSLGPPRPVAIAAGEIGSRLPEFAMKELQGRELIRFARKASESGRHKPTCFHGVSECVRSDHLLFRQMDRHGKTKLFSSLLLLIQSLA